MNSSRDSSSGFSDGSRTCMTALGLLSMGSAIRFCCVVLALACASGCARAVLVPEGSPVRIGPETRARIYVMTDEGWTLSENRVDVPEGWYCVPPSFVEDER